MNQQSAFPPRQIIYRLPSILDPLRFSELFSSPLPVEVELGSGDGSFLVDYAAARPDVNLIGIERLLGRLRKIERKANRRNLDNLRAIRIENVYFTQYLLPQKSVQAIHVYFPDPWPKRRHRQNRLINESFPTLVEKVLIPTGIVFLRTDDGDYFNQMKSVFGTTPLFEEIPTPAALLELKTDFERDFNAQGIPTLSAAYKIR